MDVLTAPALPAVGDRPDTRQLAARAALGDREAFGDLYEATRPLVLGYLRKHVRDRSAADDLLSVTYLRALAAIGSWTDTGKEPAAWLLTIARNSAADRARSAHLRRSFPTSDMCILDAAQWDADPAEQVLAAEMSGTVLAVLGAMPHAYARILTMRFIDGRSTTEVAEAMGKSVGALKAMQHRACRALLRSLPEDLACPP